MSYLLDYINTFSDEEKTIFLKLDLKGKEELIRDEYIRNAKSVKFIEQDLPKKFQLTQVHFDKIISIILSKLLKANYHDELEKMFTSLHKKGLSNLLLHEIKINERKLASSKNQPEKIAFYKIVFGVYSAMFHPTYNSKLTHKYGAKYLEVLEDKASIEDIVYVTFQIHYADMLSQYFAGNEDKYRKKAFQLFDKWEAKITHSNSNFALFYFHYIKATSIKFYGTDVNEFNNLLLVAIKNLKKCDYLNREKYLFKTYCELGFGYIELGQYEHAYKIYAQAFNTKTKPANMSSYHASTYFNVCILSNHFNEATEVFNAYLKVYLNNGVNRSVQFDIYINAFILYMYTKKYTTAYEYLTIIKSYKKNEVTQNALILIRVCENLYFYSIKDYKLSIVLSKRNKKYLSRPEYKTEQYSYFLNFFNCLNLYNIYKEKNIKIPNELLLQKKQLKSGMYDLFNNLIIE